MASADGDVAAALRRVGLYCLRAAQLFSGWSERIPGSGHLADGFESDEIRVVFGGPPAPHAITFEAPHAPYWKHPVFARGPRSSWWWVAQIPPRRFLLPAADASERELAKEFGGLIDKWALEFGFHPE